MLNLDNVTLVSMSSVNMNGTINALRKSMNDINYKSVKLITNHNINLTDIEVCKIDEIHNINQYSYNMIYKLSDYVDTDFALIIQADGFVINPSAWMDEFLKYDYIGAPFPSPIDSFSYRDINNKIFRVGNGGFSLRSKKLIDLPNKISLEWKPFHGFYNEDGFICAMNRHIYEENGCFFAPVDIAKYFSHESDIPENLDVSPFGFHGKWSKFNPIK